MRHESELRYVRQLLVLSVHRLRSVREMTNFESKLSLKPVSVSGMINVRAVSTDDLRELADGIRKELDARQIALQSDCDHPEYVDIMYMRPGATYRGCKVYQAHRYYRGHFNPLTSRRRPTCAG